MSDRYLLLYAGLAACALSASSGLHAETSERIVVTATRTTQLADEVLAPVIVIERTAIEAAQATDIADLLRFHAGLDVGRNGGPGQSASLFIRGTESNHTLVMIDNVKINPGTIGGAAFQHLSPDLVERIEIVKGPRSALYGSEAVGGVINIITRRAPEGFAGLALRGGSYHTRGATTGFSFGRGGVRAGVDVAALRTDGFPSRDASTIDRGHDNSSVNARIAFAAGPFDVELQRYQAGGTTEYLDFFLNPVDQDFRNSVSAVHLAAVPGAAWSTNLRLSEARDEIDQNQGGDFVHSRRSALDWQNDVQLTDHQLVSAGLWFAREDAASLSFGTAFDEMSDNAAVFVQDALEQGAHRALVAARYTDHEAFGGHTTWDLEYGYRFAPGARLTAALGTAFRAPDATDRYGYGGDPDLEPETARNAELGLRLSPGPRQQLSIDLFDNRIKDLVEYDWLASRMVNIGRARIRGIEAAYRLAHGAWRIDLEAVVQNPENEITGDPLPRRAERSLTAGFDLIAAHVQWHADLLAVDERKDSDYSAVVLGGYALLNLGAALPLGREWRIAARVENLLDKEYRLADGYNTAERSYMVEIAYRRGGGGQ